MGLIKWYINKYLDKFKEQFKGSKNPAAKKVIDISTGQIYRTLVYDLIEKMWHEWEGVRTDY